MLATQWPRSWSELILKCKSVTTHLQRAPVWTDNSLPPLDKALLIPDNVTNLDNIAGNVVVQNLDSLSYGHSSGKELDHITSFQDDVRVVCFSRCPHSHRTMDEVKGASDTLST